MGPEASVWRIPLHFKPQVLHAAMVVHGRRAAERRQVRGLWGLNLFRYPGTVDINGRSYVFQSGFAGIFPPGAQVVYRPGEAGGVHAAVHFSLPELRTDAVPIQAVQDLGERFGSIEARLGEAIGWFPTALRRAEVRVWDILWELAGPEGGAAVHPAVESARQWIELRLGQTIRVAAMARELQLSHTHLTRLFHAATGQTVAGYIRHRRIQRAQHLLAHTTAPICDIAAEVGIGDLQLFNKAIRKALGASPRQVRHVGAATP